MLRRVLAKFQLLLPMLEDFDNLNSIAHTSGSQSATSDTALPDTAVYATGSSDNTAGPQVPQIPFAPVASKRKVSVDEDEIDELYYDMYKISLQPRKKLVRRARSLSSTSDRSNHTSSSSPELPVVEYATFRYLDLPPELQRMVLRYAFEPNKITRFPSYDYLIPYQNSQESNIIMRGHRIRLSIHFDLPRLFVSHQFLKDAVEVFGKLSFPKTQTVSVSRGICGGALTLQHSPASFIHPRRRIETSVLQKTLTDLLAVSRKLNFQQQFAFIQKETLDLLVSRMPLLQKIEAFVPHELVWIRTCDGMYPPPGSLSWLSLDGTGLSRRNRMLKVAVLSKGELKELENGRCLPQDLCKVFSEDPDLIRCNAEAASFKQDVQDRRAVASISDGSLATTPGSLDTTLLFSVNALALKSTDHYKIITISVKFDGHSYSVTNIKSRREKHRVR